MSKKPGILVDNKPLIYLACLYSLRADADLMQTRFERVERVSAKLIVDGVMVFSPIVYNHAMAVKYDFPKGFDFWQTLDETFINHCDEVWVLEGDMPWYESVGVNYEVRYALSKGMDVRYLVYDDKTDTYEVRELPDKDKLQ